MDSSVGIIVYYWCYSNSIMVTDLNLLCKSLLNLKIP